MKKLLLILTAVFISVQVFAQHRDEVVYLKDGSEIHGTVIQYKPGVKIRIQTRDGSLFVYQMDEVDHLSKNIRPRSSTSLLGRGYLVLRMQDSPFPSASISPPHTAIKSTNTFSWVPEWGVTFRPFLYLPQLVTTSWIAM